MKNPGSLYLFAFHSVAAFCSLAGLLVAGMALLLPETDGDRLLRGLVLFAAFGLIAKFADRALQQAEGA